MAIQTTNTNAPAPKPAPKPEAPKPAAIKRLSPDPAPKVQSPVAAPEPNRAAKVEAYVRLCNLGAAPAYDFSPPLLGAELRDMQNKVIGVERDKEIARNRKILGLG